MGKIKKTDIETLITLALNEDIQGGDITSEAIFRVDQITHGNLISKDNGIFCGEDLIHFVYEMIDTSISVEIKKPDGSRIDKGDIIARIEGPPVGILKGERTVLNFIQRMSGIATKTDHFVQLLVGTGIEILDTRKTLPGHRILDKHAVATGNGTNHRMGLYDMVMIKDNHIKAAGSIQNAVQSIRKSHGNKYIVEVEASSLDEVKDAVDSEIDIIMLDNMDKKTMKKAITLIDGKAKIEVSGNIDKEKIKEIRDLTIDFISMGALTHSVNAFDISMKFL